MRKQKTFTHAAALALGLGLPVSVEAQKIVDAGRFTVSVNGQRVGSEDFTIETTPIGQGIEYIARATIAYGDRRVSPVLRADSNGVPMAYQVALKVNASEQETWRGLINHGRVSARIKNAKGESEKEYIVANGAFVLDEDVFHQYYFLARKRGDGSASVMIPRRNNHAVVKISSAGNDRVAIGNKELEASHLVIGQAGSAPRDVWVDDQGRVLKVAISDRGLVALRDDPPR
jgi:hypothetical protein